MSDQLHAIELSIQHAKKNVDRMKALQRLTQHQDFKQVILTDYFEKEPARLVMLKSDPAMQGKDNQDAILKQMDAIGELRQYLNGVMQLGRMSEKAIQDDEAMREELLAEGDTESAEEGAE